MDASARKTRSAPSQTPAPAPAQDTTRADDEASWRRLTGAAALTLAVIATVAALAQAHLILVPVIAGLTIGFILGPLADRAGRLGIPVALANTAIVVAVLTGLWLVSILFVPIVSDVIARAPEHAANIREKLGELERSVETVNELARLLAGQAPGRAMTVRVDGGQAAAVASVLGAITPALTQLVIFIFTLVLFLAGRRALRDRAVLTFKGRENRLTTLKIFSGIEDRMLGYFATVTLINLGLGLLAGLALWLVGMPGAAAWGFLAFLLNFMPVVGPLLLKALLLAAGILVMPTLGWAFAPLGAFLALQVIEANVVTPWLIGRRLTLEPLLIFLAIVFLTWLWGPVGAFLAPPLVIVALIVHQHATPDTAAPMPLPDREELRSPSMR